MTNTTTQISNPSTTYKRLGELLLKLQQQQLSLSQHWLSWLKKKLERNHQRESWDINGGYSNTAETDPQGPTEGEYHSYRGGCYAAYAQHCRNTRRPGKLPDGFGNYLGFRLALSK